jgi:hypothetical protein
VDDQPPKVPPVPPKQPGNGGGFKPGYDPRRGRNGGRTNRLAEIQRMLDDEHRTVENLRETYGILRQVAHGVDEPVYYKGEVCGHVRKYDSAFMALYLNRIQGPIKELISEDDLADAPDAVVEWLYHRN